MTAEEAAIDLIYHYVWRGDNEKHLQQSYLGAANSDYMAMIRGKFVEVTRLGEKVVNDKIDYHKLFQKICNFPEVREHHNYLRAVAMSELTCPIIYLIQQNQ